MNPKTMNLISCRTEKELIRETLKRIDWKTSYGIAVHVGIDQSIPRINHIADWINERCGQWLAIIDAGIKTDSVLKTLTGAFYRAPPSVKGDVRMHLTSQELLDEKGEAKFPIHFLSVPTGAGEAVTGISKGVKPGTLIFGTPDACADVLEAASLSAQPIFYCGGMLTVRAA